jgi:hypothetical protein
MTNLEVETVVEMTRQYGEVLSAEEARTLLKFKSASAFWMARRRGQLQLEVIRVPGRKQFMYSTQEVALLLVKWKTSARSSPEKEVPMA